MKKNNLFRILSLVLAPVAFTACFFLLAGVEHGPTCWIGYGFIMFAMLVYIGTPMILPLSPNTYLFGLTSNVFTAAYMGVMAFLGLILMIADFDAWQVALVLELIPTVAFFVLYFRNASANEATAKMEQVKQENITAVKNLSALARSVMANPVDAESRAYLKRVFDEIDTFSLRRNSQTDMIDAQLEYNLKLLDQAALMNDKDTIKALSSKIITLAQKRKTIA